MTDWSDSEAGAGLNLQSVNDLDALEEAIPEERQRRREAQRERQQRQAERERQEQTREWLRSLERDDLELLANDPRRELPEMQRRAAWQLSRPAFNAGHGKSDIVELAAQELRRRRQQRQQTQGGGGTSTSAIDRKKASIVAAAGAALWILG